MPLEFASYNELFQRGIDVRAAWCEKCRTHEAHAYDKAANRLTCVVCDTAQPFNRDMEILGAEFVG
ncbi:MAG TPA: hypothetical protein VF290_22125 [Pyrinomonadaceae bacterium]